MMFDLHTEPLQYFGRAVETELPPELDGPTAIVGVASEYFNLSQGSSVLSEPWWQLQVGEITPRFGQGIPS